MNNVNLGSCKSYSDGCNTCSVGDNGLTACTQMYCFQAGTPKCLDVPVIGTGTDTQLTDLEKAKQNTTTKTLSTDFKLKTFNSCDNMESVMKNFIKDYYKAHPYGGGYYYRSGPELMMEDSVGGVAPSVTSSNSVK